MLWIKICGITSLEDAELAIAAGADAVGLNLIPTSKRYIESTKAREISEAVRGRVATVGVVANQTLDELQMVLAATGVELLQLHGGEPPELVASLAPRAYKAVAIGSSRDVEEARGFPGDRLLLDAKVVGELGGTGQRFDWSLAGLLARERRVILAGGLTPENVGEAVSQVKPWGVDVASGVESGDPRRKDRDKVRAFVAAVRAAAVESALE